MSDCILNENIIIIINCPEYVDKLGLDNHKADYNNHWLTRRRRRLQRESFTLQEKEAGSIVSIQDVQRWDGGLLFYVIVEAVFLWHKFVNFGDFLKISACALSFVGHSSFDNPM